MGPLRKPTRKELDSAFDRIFLVEGVVSRRQAEPLLEILITTAKLCKAMHTPPSYVWPGVDQFCVWPKLAWNLLQNNSRRSPESSDGCVNSWRRKADDYAATEFAAAHDVERDHARKPRPAGPTMPERNITTPMDVAIGVLREYDAAFKKILTAAYTSRDPEKKREAQVGLRDLKERFKLDIRKFERFKRTQDSRLHPVRTMLHTLQEASARIHVRWTMDPLGPDWTGDVYSAHGDVTFYLRQLERMAEEATKSVDADT